MLPRHMYHRCIRSIDRSSILIRLSRLNSTTPNPIPLTVEDDTSTTEAIDTNVSRLPEDIYRQYKGLPPTDVKEQYHTRNKLRSLWGKYGNKTAIDPKLCWPTQSEMDEIIDDERVYNMELSEKLKIVEERRQAKKKEFDQIQAKVEKNLKTMPKLVEDFKKRMNEREKAAKAETKVKNDLAEQARDFYGFSVDPNDERLQFMLLQLEEAQKAEEKKARKAAKKLEAHQQLQKLMGIGQTEEQSEQPDPMAAVPEPKDKETDMKLFAKLVSERSKLAKAASKIAEEQAAVQNKTSKKK